MQPLGGGQAAGRLSGALGLPPPPPPLPGEVHLWGRHTDGELACTAAQAHLGQRAPGEVAALSPSVLPRSKGLDVAAVSLGALHGALLSRAGQVFTWGTADHGRLGHGSQHHIAAPLRVEALAGMRATQVACGDMQTAAVTEDGQLFVWG